MAYGNTNRYLGVTLSGDVTYGIDGNVRNWIQAFLRNRTQSVIVEGTKSTHIQVESGVPQGSVLVPAIFLIYIDDLPEAVQSKTRLFAEDTTYCNTIKTAEDQHQLQADLDSLTTWEDRWSMTFTQRSARCSISSERRKPKSSPTQFMMKNCRTHLKSSILG
jgi:hypothetical protein